VGTVDLLAAVQIPQASATASSFVALTLNVLGDDANESDLVKFSTFRPCYLVDTQTSTPAQSVDLLLGTGAINTKINGIFFSSPTEYLNSFAVGTLNEIVIKQGAFVHTMHIHVFPFQVRR
jgi:hypothetical protein